MRTYKRREVWRKLYLLKNSGVQFAACEGSMGIRWKLVQV